MFSLKETVEKTQIPPTSLVSLVLYEDSCSAGKSLSSLQLCDFLSHVCACVCVFIYYKTSDDFISAAQHTLYTVH